MKFPKLFSKAFLAMLLLHTISSSAQKLKSNSLILKALSYPEKPISTNYSSFSLVTNVTNPNNVYPAKIDVKALSKKFMIFDSIKMKEEGGDFIVEFNLNTTPPTKTLGATFGTTEVFYEYKSTYTVKSTNGLTIEQGNVKYTGKATVNEQMGQPEPTDNPENNLNRQFVGLAQIIKQKYDFKYLDYRVTLFHLKDDKYKAIEELNDSIIEKLKGSKVRIPVSGIDKMVGRSILMNKNFLAQADRNNPEMENLVFCTTSNLLNCYTLLWDEEQTVYYESEISKMDKGGMKKGSAVQFYQAYALNVKTYQEQIDVLKNNPNANKVSGINSNSTYVKDQAIKDGFFIRSGVLSKDTSCCTFVDHLLAESTREINIIAKEGNTEKQVIKSGDLAYFYVNDFLYKSITPDKNYDPLLVGPEEAKWHGKNAFAIVYYESDNIFFGVITKKDKKLYYLINKKTDVREECPIPSSNQIVTEKLIKKFFTNCFNADMKLSDFLEMYDFKKKSALEFFEIVSKCEEFYGGGKATYDNNLTRLMNLKNSKKCK